MISMTKGKKKRIGRGNIEIEDLGDIKLSPALDDQIEARIKRAENALASIAVNFRWQRGQLNLVKKVAATMGVPYQTYIKMVLYKQAQMDWAFINGKINTPNFLEKPRSSSWDEYLSNAPVAPPDYIADVEDLPLQERAL